MQIVALSLTAVLAVVNPSETTSSSDDQVSAIAAPVASLTERSTPDAELAASHDHGTWHLRVRPMRGTGYVVLKRWC